MHRHKESWAQFAAASCAALTSLAMALGNTAAIGYAESVKGFGKLAPEITDLLVWPNK